ncbi:MAG: excalibur calcium-binding domain-containing protein [Betaproteobacteria bacterium]|nr:excalibur calcium-binding domain-containing protein [Betaproteobacteria bacterium]
MKKLLFLSLIAFGAWNYFEKQTSASIDGVPAPNDDLRVAEAIPSGKAQRFSCDGRIYCSDMTSRAEAEYFSKYCPGTKMDGDRDGMPCEDDSRF